MSAKTIALWIAGALLLLFGSFIVRYLDFNIGVGEFSYIFAVVIAFVLFLLAGLCWISTAVAARHE